ncbi:MAG TPA: DNA polymerase/3'-5' exonuclease PolX [Gammaproteobacteria bacterium]|nr:DNA polymerase/3'-5' exonuclease PolX [Gammaproteobacteria bacterium]
MPVHNEDIAAIFDELADLLEIDEANPFRVRAYRNAARTVRSLGTELSEMVGRGEDLTRLPGIGKDLAAKIVEILDTGKAAALTKLHKEVPASLEQLLEVPGLGPKRVKALYQELGIKTRKQLLAAARGHKLRALEGFGEKTEQRIIDNLAAERSSERRFLLATAVHYGEPLLAYLNKTRGVGEALIAGSYRRGRETVGDLDILVSATDHAEVMRRFVAYDEVEDVVSQGETRATVILRSGLQVDLRVMDKQSLGAALHYFTGSKAHNIHVRRLGQQRGLKINEYGVFRGDERIAGTTEASVYKTLDLPYIPPELREDRGELEAARDGKLPELVELDDLQGDLHVHTDATDGQRPLQAMVEAARGRGLSYVAITDHSRRLTVAHGLDEKRLRAQLDAIDELNANLKGFAVLKGVEVDILEDGSLDLPDSVLGELDLVIGAVHSHFGLSRKKQTARIQRAMDGPHFSILAHPSGRLLLERDAYDVDMERLIDHAAERGCFLELDAQPKRLDLTDVYCQAARDAGVLVAVNSDAHAEADFDNLRFGIGQARRGWLEKQDVLNTRPLGALRRLLGSTLS